MLSYLRGRIQTSGPLTVAHYMREALTNPEWGYYMKREVFGRQGDFITSPEISQTFGEVIGAWLLHQWRATGAQSPVRLIELGPGRGTLTSDILRTVCQFGDVRSSLHVHLVEISPYMRGRQRRLLCPGATDSGSSTGGGNEPLVTASTQEPAMSDEHVFKEHKDLGKEHQSRFGVPVTWHASLDDVPAGHSLVIGHEFLDALPVHQFQKTEQGWREVLVDVNDGHGSDEPNPPPFRFVLSPKPTPALAYIETFHRESGRDRLEISPQLAVVAQQICERLVSTGGMSLLVDYGEAEPRAEFSFRSFHQHSLHDALRDPGNADLTADVDFSYLRHIAEPHVQCYGPVPQGFFLHSLGIKERLQVLLKKSNEEQRKQLISGLQHLTSPKQMGMRFKMFAMTPKQCVVAPPPFVLRDTAATP
ncbi:protein arginine methyltransferase NDUFAF7, mitochondrial-like [Sycon ciliatum]|uniref:protein arginine methyltransferase NDUFAF7, mitochondrial-like n=1 Tax=Sycon ciliatum TaxID=27933 RepID=UPI0031F6DB80